jgi:hypothetical protein
MGAKRFAIVPDLWFKNIKRHNRQAPDRTKADGFTNYRLPYEGLRPMELMSL